MNLIEFIERICDDGIAAVEVDYAHDEHKRRGAIEGFSACRGKNTLELAALLQNAREAKRMAHRFTNQENIGAYWETVCYEAEIMWVCNCVSAVLMNEGQPVIIPPTARGAMKAAEVIGVGTHP